MLWILLTIILIMLFFPINIYIKYDNKREKKIESKIILFKDLAYIPFILNAILNRFKNTKKDKMRSSNYQKLKKYLYMYKKPAKYFWKHIKLENISWDTCIGYKNAASTAVLTGILWPIKYNILLYILREKKVEELYINVEPYFNKKRFQTQVSCIIRCQLVHIIIVSIWILILNKGGERFARTSYRRINEGYND